MYEIDTVLCLGSDIPKLTGIEKVAKKAFEEKEKSPGKKKKGKSKETASDAFMTTLEESQILNEEQKE